MTIRARVADPNGFDDIASVRLYDASSTFLADFTGSEGTYEVDVTWDDLHDADPIDFEMEQTYSFEVEAVDREGAFVTETVDVGLYCEGGALACDGVCTPDGCDAPNNNNPDAVAPFAMCADSNACIGVSGNAGLCLSNIEPSFPSLCIFSCTSDSECPLNSECFMSTDTGGLDTCLITCTSTADCPGMQTCQDPMNIADGQMLPLVIPPNTDICLPPDL